MYSGSTDFQVGLGLFWCCSPYTQVSVRRMAYPGNLYALVARDQHLSCNANDYGGTPREKPKLDRAISRRFETKRAEPNVEDGVGKRTAVAVASRGLPVNPTTRAFRLGLGPSKVTLGANTCRTSPSDWGQRMDHGIFCETSNGHSVSRAVSINRAVRYYDNSSRIQTMQCVSRMCSSS